MTDQPTMTDDLARSIKAGCEAHECVYPTCIASDGTLCRQHQRYLLAALTALAALDPPSAAVVATLAEHTGFSEKFEVGNHPNDVDDKPEYFGLAFTDGHFALHYLLGFLAGLFFGLLLLIKQASH